MRLSDALLSVRTTHRRWLGPWAVCGAFFLALALLGLAPAARAADADKDQSPPPETDLYQQLEKPQDILQHYPPMQVKPRIPALSQGEYYPCSDCHNEDQPANPIVRELEEEHDTFKLEHGRGQFWCLTCHNKDDRDSLASLKGKSISFDESFLVCLQCHSTRQDDFFYGGHGKRVGSWRGEKVVTPCTECHNPHSPKIKPRKPFRPPHVRKGLEEKRADVHREENAVERIAVRHGAAPAKKSDHEAGSHDSGEPGAKPASQE